MHCTEVMYIEVAASQHQLSGADGGGGGGGDGEGLSVL